MRASDTMRMIYAQQRLAAAAAVDYILDVRELTDYVEIVAKSGAGITIYHIYDDGSVRAA